MLDESWKALHVEGIAKIKKCVAEYSICELYKSPYGKFKIKIYEDADGHFSGYSNLQIKDTIGNFCCAVGFGRTEIEALKDTINEFLKMVSIKQEWIESDFICSDPFDF